MDNSSMSLKVAQLEGELAKTLSDHQCEADRNEHLKKMFNLMEMEKEALAERLMDLQRKLQAELEESSRRIGIMENEVAEYQNQLRITTDEVTKSESEKKELMTRINEMENNINRAYEEKRAVEEQMEGLQGELTRVTVDLKRLQTEHESSLEDTRAKLQVELRKVQAEHEGALADLRMRLQVSSAYERRSKDLESKVGFLEGEVKRAKDETVRADRRATELENAVKKTEAECAGTGQVVSQLEAMLGKYKEEVKTLEREKYECTKKAAELEGLLARMKSDAQKWDEEKVAMKERTWKAERDLEVMRQERDKMRLALKEKDSAKHQDTYLSGWMKNLKPISNVIWGEQKVYGPLVKNINDYFVLERRGSRKDSRVWRCKSKALGQFYALKTLPQVIPQNAQGSTDFTIFREAMLLKIMDHPNIIRLEGIYQDKGNLNLLLSPFVEIDLDYSIGQKTMNSSEIKNLLHQLLLAVAYMHKQDLVHRNIKPTSILRFEDYTLKLCGFTYARSVHQALIDMIVPKSPVWYYAPEIFAAQTSSKAQKSIDWKAVDMWAIGCVFAEMLLQKPLFAGNADPLTSIFSILECRPKDLNNANGSLYPSAGSQSLGAVLAKSSYNGHPSFRAAASLLRDLLAFEPSSRCTAAQALQHEYFSDIAVPQEQVNRGKDISKDVLDSCIPEFVQVYCSGVL